MAKRKEISKAPVNVTVLDVMEEKAEMSAKNRSKGGEDVKVSLTDTVKVRFTSDYGYMRAGQTATISALAFEIYDRNKVVEKI